MLKNAAPPARRRGASNDVIKPLYYAARSWNLPARYGLTVEILPMNNGAASAAALIGGDLDVASVSILTPLQAHLKGIPMRILAPSLWNTSDAATVFTVVLKDSPLRTGRNLDGKTVGVPRELPRTHQHRQDLHHGSTTAATQRAFA